MQSSGQEDVDLSPMADDRAVESADYHSLCVLAVISLVIGVAAPLCLFAPLLTAVPLFGAAIALVALRRIACSDGVMVGRAAALVGLILCIVSVSAAASRNWGIEYLRTRQATAAGIRWIELLNSGHEQQAYNMTVEGIEPANRRDADEPAEAAVDPVEQFAAQPAVEAVLSIGASAGVRFTGNLSYQPHSNGTCLIVQRYLVTPTGDQAGQRPIAVRLSMQRGYAPGMPQMQWMVASCELDDPSTATGPAG